MKEIAQKHCQKLIIFNLGLFQIKECMLFYHLKAQVNQKHFFFTNNKHSTEHFVCLYFRGIDKKKTDYNSPEFASPVAPGFTFDHISPYPSAKFASLQTPAELVAYDTTESAFNHKKAKFYTFKETDITSPNNVIVEQASERTESS